MISLLENLEIQSRTTPIIRSTHHRVGEIPHQVSFLPRAKRSMMCRISTENVLIRARAIFVARSEGGFNLGMGHNSSMGYNCY